MVAIPLWITGPGGGYACVITPQANSGGTITDTTVVQTVTTNLDSVRVDSRVDLENISGLTSPRRNMVAIETGTAIELNEIVATTATYPSKLAYLAYAHTWVKVALTRAVLVWTFYGIIESYSENIVKGKTIGTLRVEMVDIGSANPTYA